MLKNQFKILCYLIAMFSSIITLPFDYDPDPRIALRASKILEAELLLNKIQALESSIIKKRLPYLEVQLEKLREQGKLYGTLSIEEKNELLQLIKKERNSEKNKLKKYSSEERTSLIKKGIGILALGIFEFYLFKKMEQADTINSLKAFDAISKRLLKVLSICNGFFVGGISIWMLCDLFKIEALFNIRTLKSMKELIRL